MTDDQLHELKQYFDARLVQSEQRIKSDIKNDLSQGFAVIDQRFEGVDQRFEVIDQRFESVDQRFERIDQQFVSINQQFERIDQRFEVIDQNFIVMNRKMDAGFSGVAEAIENLVDHFDSLLTQHDKRLKVLERKNRLNFND